MAQEPRADFGVFLERGGVKIFVEVSAGSPQLAADAAEELNRGWKAIAVTTRAVRRRRGARMVDVPAARRNVAGRCCRCGGVLFADDRPLQIGLRLRCHDPC